MDHATCFGLPVTYSGDAKGCIVQTATYALASGAEDHYSLCCHRCRKVASIGPSSLCFHHIVKHDAIQLLDCALTSCTTSTVPAYLELVSGITRPSRPTYPQIYIGLIAVLVAISWSYVQTMVHTFAIWLGRVGKLSFAHVCSKSSQRHVSATYVSRQPIWVLVALQAAAICADLQLASNGARKPLPGRHAFPAQAPL